MKPLIVIIVTTIILTSCMNHGEIRKNEAYTETSIYLKPDSDTHTRWFSPENPKGEVGKGALTNRGAKGNAFFIVQPGETQELMNMQGAGIVQRMWMSGTIAKSPEQRRGVILNMYWDNHEEPAVSAPIGDFFGNALGIMTSFDNEFFSNPEGRSFNFTIPMPFRTGARIEIVNESPYQVLFWYDINVQQVRHIPQDAMYFHAHWRRDMKTKLGEDFVLLPEVNGTGRYLGTSVGVIGDKGYLGTWFGEGIVKIYLDGDNAHPTLVGTGTEDYIGTGWGQGVYYAQRFGSLVSNEELDIYSFYRFHTADAVYFHDHCKVTIQQMGSANRDLLRKMVDNGLEVTPVWQLQTHGLALPDPKPGKILHHIRFLDMETPPDLFGDDFIADLPTNYYRRDDVSATSYFYLDKPVNNLPELQTVDIRVKDMKSKVWDLLETN